METFNILTLVVRTDNYTIKERNWLLNRLSLEGNEALMKLFTHKKVIPFGAKTCCNLGYNTDYWEPVLIEYRKRNERVLHFLNSAYTSMRKRGVERVFVSENFGALLSAGYDLALFSSGDVDNFCHIEEYPKIKEALCGLGCKVKEIYAGNNHVASKFYAPKNYNLPDNFYFGLDFYPLARKGLPCFIDADKFIFWDECISYKGTEIILPSKDVLAYICMMHVSLHRYCQAPDIKLYFDLKCIEGNGYNEDILLCWSNMFKTNCRMAIATSISNILMRTSYTKSLTGVKRCESVLPYILNKEHNGLLYHPSLLRVLNIEAKSNDSNDLLGLLSILFPEKQWIKKTYGNNLIIAYIRHFINIL